MQIHGYEADIAFVSGPSGGAGPLCWQALVANCVSQANHAYALATSDCHRYLQDSTGRTLPRDRLPAALLHNLKAQMDLHHLGCPTQFGGLLAYIKSMLTRWAAVRVLQGLVGLHRLCLSMTHYT